MNELGKILIVDDDFALTRILSQELTIAGYLVNIVNNGGDALDITKSEIFDLILLDYKMPDISGLDVLKILKQNNYPAKIIVMTGYGDVELALECSRLGASDFLSKPYDLDELLIAIRKVLYSS